ncbi:hypothetical protein GOBAR_DD03978 [Gossypium barbadense]|nr:hypothetical protein GOBAR_DD03978 [Gossypium barbadense]
MPGEQKKNIVREEGERSGSKLSKRGRKIKCHKFSMDRHNSKRCQTSSISMPPPVRAAPAPPALVALAALALSDLAPPTPETQILTRLRSRGKQVVQGIELYTDESIGIQILNLGMRRESMATASTKCTNKRKGSNNKETAGGTQESRNTKKAKSRDLSNQNLKPWK